MVVELEMLGVAVWERPDVVDKEMPVLCVGVANVLSVVLVQWVVEVVLRVNKARDTASSVQKKSRQLFGKVFAMAAARPGSGDRSWCIRSKVEIVMCGWNVGMCCCGKVRAVVMWKVVMWCCSVFTQVELKCSENSSGTA